MNLIAGIARPVLKQWPLVALITALAMLAIAHAFETFGGLAPCTLCLRQREVYWVAASVAALGVLISYSRWRPLGDRAAGWALAAVFLFGMGVAVWHAGAEWKFWPGPATCSGGGGKVTAAAMQDLLNGARLAAPRCDEAAWRFLGLSMAGWNVLISLKMAVWSVLAGLGWEPKRV